VEKGDAKVGAGGRITGMRQKSAMQAEGAGRVVRSIVTVKHCIVCMTESEEWRKAMVGIELDGWRFILRIYIIIDD
jgi:hypothetical protein